MSDNIVFMLDGMTGHDVAIRLSKAVKELGPYVDIVVDDERVEVKKEEVRICSDD